LSKERKSSLFLPEEMTVGFVLLGHLSLEPFFEVLLVFVDRFLVLVTVLELVCISAVFYLSFSSGTVMAEISSSQELEQESKTRTCLKDR
jgi:hypothetical protein